MSQSPNNLAGEQSTNDTAGDDHGSRTPTLSEIFETLVAERRRNALYVLYRQRDSISVADLGREVASLEAADPERVTTALYHVHVPKLADMGVVHYDTDAKTVCLAHDSDRFRHYVTAAAEDENRTLRRATDSATLEEF